MKISRGALTRRAALTSMRSQMAQFFSESVYTFKRVPQVELARTEREIDPPNTGLENQIFAHIFAGHLYFFLGQYQKALQEYLAAWALLPKVVEPFFPVDIVRTRPDLLLAVNLVDPLVEVSAELLHFRGKGYTDPVPFLGSEQTLPQLAPFLREAGLLGVSYVPEPAEGLLQKAVAKTQLGQHDQANKLLQMAAQTARSDAVKASVQTALGVVLSQTGQPEQAAAAMQSAVEGFTRAGNREGIGAVSNNLAVVHQRQGRFEVAARHLQTAADLSPLELNRTVVEKLNPVPGAETMRPMGAAGFQFILPSADGPGKWSTLRAEPAAVLVRTQAGVLVSDKVLAVPFNQTGQQVVREKVYEARVNATKIRELLTFEELGAAQEITYLAHASGFLLPMALGDTYYELGQYNKAISFFAKARDYKYLNLAIEMPTVWKRMARCFLDDALLQYKKRDMAAARALLENIVRISGSSLVFSGPLYTGSFASLGAKCQAYFASANKLTFPDLDYQFRAILSEAHANLKAILANINYLGFPEDIIPIQTFRYLQNVARYFTDHAIQAERTFITFKSRAEEEAATRRMLEDQMALEQASLAVEQQRVEAAEAQRDAAQASADLAALRVQQAIDTLTEFEDVSWQLQEIDASLALANASANDTEIEVGPARAKQLGIEPGTYEASDYAKLLTRRRNQVNREFERHNLERRRDEANAAQAAADKQVTVANQMIDVAKEQLEVAQLRLEGAQARLEAFDDEFFTHELWDNLAREIRDIARQYLRWAIGAAFLMERAFEFEFDIEVNRIRFDYEQSELAGLLGGDFLKRDIDSFTYDLLLETEKRQPLKEIISLAERFPYQFYRHFQKTGRIDFETALLDFDRRKPGCHLQKIRRVEMIVDGLIPAEGLHGTLTNSGVSHFRNRQGVKKTRLQKPETMLLSRFSVRDDSVIFPPQEETLELFENTGVATGWILDIPPRQNNVDYLALVDVKLVLYYDAFFSNTVAAVVSAELAAEPNTYSFGFGLAFEFPEAFFELQDTGEVVFTLSDAELPYYQTDPRISNLTLILESKDGAPLNGIGLEVEATTAAVSDTTDANGQIAADPAGGPPLNAFLTQSLLDTWHVRVKAPADPAAYSNIFFWVEYSFTPRVL
jgi:tetratricopeptide (TPR) repeat protein